MKISLVTEVYLLLLMLFFVIYHSLVILISIQTRRLGSISDVDNSPQSLLSFSGNKDVHALYDFMLNYRSFLTSLTSVDVPLLCSPVPFQNAALSAPEVSCGELKRADHVAFPLKGSKMKDEANEIKDAYIPPCATMGSKGRSFEARYDKFCHCA
eukprot:XP_019075521.1 PREDICTED: uncharacterized protein LOC104879388 isoform X1 [Vitis vinifera]